MNSVSTTPSMSSRPKSQAVPASSNTSSSGSEKCAWFPEVVTNGLSYVALLQPAEREPLLARGRLDLGDEGAPVAVIGPPRARFLSAERFRELVASAPRVDDEFAVDLAAIRREVEAPREPLAVLIDTDVLVAPERGDEGAGRSAGDEPRAISVITVSEL